MIFTISSQVKGCRSLSPLRTDEDDASIAPNLSTCLPPNHTNDVNGSQEAIRSVWRAGDGLPILLRIPERQRGPG
jgi:hypothetical protein